jgi:hypothetical protein
MPIQLPPKPRKSRAFIITMSICLFFGVTIIYELAHKESVPSNQNLEAVPSAAYEPPPSQPQSHSQSYYSSANTLQTYEARGNVETYLAENLKDPDSYQSIKWGGLITVNAEMWMYTIDHRYRAKNSFGGYVINQARFFLDSKGTVVKVMSLD